MGSNWAWFNITQPTNNNPSAPKIVIHNDIREYTTWYVYPAFFNSRWIIGYALECTIVVGAGSTYQRLMVQGNNIVEFNQPDDVIVDKLRNGVWYKKTL